MAAKKTEKEMFFVTDEDNEVLFVTDSMKEVLESVDQGDLVYKGIFLGEAKSTLTLKK